MEVPPLGLSFPSRQTAAAPFEFSCSFWICACICIIACKKKGKQNALWRWRQQREQLVFSPLILKTVLSFLNSQTHVESLALPFLSLSLSFAPSLSRAHKACKWKNSNETKELKGARKMKNQIQRHIFPPSLTSFSLSLFLPLPPSLKIHPLPGRLPSAVIASKRCCCERRCA